MKCTFVRVTMNCAQHPSGMIQFQVGEDGVVPVRCDTSSTECLLKRKRSPQRRPPVCRLATTMAFVFLVGLVTWQSVVDVGKDAGEKMEEVGKEIVQEVVHELPEVVELGKHAHEMVHDMGGVKNMARYGAIVVARFR